MILSPTSPGAFEAIYRSSPDPWQFETSAYEQFRYRMILDSLRRDAYGIAFEPGCSIGVLTAKLAGLCRRVIATDVAPTAVTLAERRCKGLGNVDVRLAAGLTEVPEEQLDLVLFSEIGYYFDVTALEDYGSALARQLVERGEFVAVHWLGTSADHVLHGDLVHETLKRSLPLTWLQGQHHDGFRIDSWVRL